MGKIVTIYLTDEETIGLRKFCEENACSQYTAIKTGLRELLHQSKAQKPTIEHEQEAKEVSEKADDSGTGQQSETRPGSLSEILRKIKT